MRQSTALVCMTLLAGGAMVLVVGPGESALPEMVAATTRVETMVDGAWERVPVDIAATAQGKPTQPTQLATVDAGIEPTQTPPTNEATPVEIPPCPLDPEVLKEAGLEDRVAAEVFAATTNAWRLYQISRRAKVDNQNQRAFALLFTAWPDLGRLVSGKKMNVRVIVQRNPKIPSGTGDVFFWVGTGGQGRPREANVTFHCPNCFVTFEFNDANAPAEQFAALFRN